MSTAIATPLLGTSVVESIFKEITSKTGRYYYFLGGTVDREGHDTLDLAVQNELTFPVSTVLYEKDTRNYIVLAKEIQPNDVAFLIKKIDWQPNVLYDMYDNRIGSEVIGLNLIAGGSGYTANANITISGGGGLGATGEVVVVGGAIVHANVILPGIGYETKPNVIIGDATGTGANIQAVLGYADSGAANLYYANYYVITDDFNIYKCLENNKGGLSYVKPLDISVEPFTLADGYKWKFMGHVPVSLRSKFLTDQEVPVTTAIKNQFYSSGEIKNVVVISTGNGYSSALLTVSGDGYLEQDPYYIVQTYIEDGGNGYSDAAVVIDPPILGSVSWSASTSYFVGKILKYNNNLYEVIKSGVSDLAGPIHTKGIQNNGTVGLKYLGTQAIANLTTNSGVITAVTLLGSIRDIEITQSGSGYTSDPPVTFTGGDGGNAAAYATILNGSVNSIVITDIGDSFTSVPTVTIGTQWVANANVSLYDQIFYNNRLYTVTSTIAQNVLSNVTLTEVGVGYFANVRNNTNVYVQTTGAFQPTSNAQVTPLYVANYLIGFTVIDNGIGYTIDAINNTSLNVYTTGSVVASTNATANLNFTDVSLDSNIAFPIRLGNTAPVHTSGYAINGYANLYYAGDKATATATLKYGSGYFRQPNITITSNTGTNAAVTAQLVKSEAKISPYIENDKITRVIINNGGTGYTYASVTSTGDGSNARFLVDLSQGDLNSLQANNELQALPGTIDAIKIISGGYDYNAANVTIVGDGTGATATANIYNNRVDKIIVQSRGSGYSRANIIITGDGKGASARAIIAPEGGHGHDIIQELYARSIGFYTTIGQEQNQGFDVTNDYRQFGIIKDIENYDNTKFFTGGTGSTCWVVNGSIDTNAYNIDDIVIRASDNFKFLIVARTSLNALLSAIDGGELQIGDVLYKTGANSIVVSGVVRPDVDKYSGKLLYIDNKLAFTSSEQQSVSIKTVFKF